MNQKIEIVFKINQLILNKVITMTYFLHVSRTKEFFDFVEPSEENIKVHTYGYGYNPGYSLYLSQVIVNSDSELSSDWKEHAKKKNEEEEEDEYEEEEGQEKDYGWVDGFHHYYKVDMNDKKILIIDKRDDVRKLFENYGIIQTSSINPYLEISDKITIYLDFLQKQEKKLINFELNPSKKNYNIDIKDGKIVVPRKGITQDFLNGVFFGLKKLYDELRERNEYLNNFVKYSLINWNKMRNEGYSGIYYTKNIIRAALSDKYIYDKDWKDFLKYLSSDTLIVWKDDVLTKETKENILKSL